MRSAPSWLASLPCRIGEIAIERLPNECFALCHRDDRTRDDLIVSQSADAAMEIARFDDAGKFRPLKTAPNLRHGWILILPSRGDAELALDFFYPGRAAAFAAWKENKLPTTPFRETLARQSGMYRVAAQISEAQANELIGNFCRSDGGCLRTILWKQDAGGSLPSTLLPDEKYEPRYDQTGRGEFTQPLLCQEPCNLLIAAARETVKSAAR